MKVEGLIQNIYRAIYIDIGVNYDAIDKSKPDWFLNHYSPQNRQDEIIESMIKGQSTFNKRLIKNTLYLGCLPRG